MDETLARRVRRPITPLVLLLCPLLCLVGCRPEPRRPNVLLIRIDTLRANRVSAYGHARDTTPFLHALGFAGEE